MPELIEPRLEQPDVLALIRAERAYQDRKWGPITDRPHEVGAWLLVMKGKLDAAIRAWQGTPGDGPALTELVKAVAVGVACLEQHAGPVVLKAIADMEFARANLSYMTPTRRAECYWPVLDVLVARMRERAELKRREDEIRELGTL